MPGHVSQTGLGMTLLAAPHFRNAVGPMGPYGLIGPYKGPYFGPYFPLWGHARSYLADMTGQAPHFSNAVGPIGPYGAP